MGIVRLLVAGTVVALGSAAHAQLTALELKCQLSATKATMK